MVLKKFAYTSKLKHWIFFFLCSCSIAKQGFAQSWMSTSNWAKISIAQSGIYKINYQDLKNWGLNVSNIDNLHLFGVQGEQISSINSQEILDRAPEISIWVEKGSDNQWNSGDYILFYATAAKDMENTFNTITHYSNPYAKNSTYIIGETLVAGKRITNAIKPTFNVQEKRSSGYIGGFHDSDIVNLNDMGRVWLGEKLGNETTNRTFQIAIPLDVDSAILRVNTAWALEEDSGSLITTVNGVNYRYTVNPIPIGSYDKYNYVSKIYKLNNLSGMIQCKLQLNRPNTKSAAYLDFFEWFAEKGLTYQGKQIVYRNWNWGNSLDIVEFKFQLSGSQTPFIWSVGNVYQPCGLFAEKVGSDLLATAIDSISSNTIIAFHPNDAFLPNFDGNIKASSNIELAGNAQLIIISHPDFIEAAAKLKEHRTAHDQLKVAIVSPVEIYNAFSAGQQDVMAIRNFIRWAKQSSIANGNELKYVTIIGAASHDMLDRTPSNTNYVPMYQSYGQSPAAIFCLDEYIGYLDAGQGDPEITQKNKLGVAVGRIPARTLEDANAFVEKLKRYDSPKSFGPWRSQVTFTSDDVDKIYETEFIYQSEEYADYLYKNNPAIKVNKIYADAYKQVMNGNSERYPDVTAAINRTFNEGSLFINYQGHGGERGWGQEAFLDIPTIKSWSNPYTMPVLFTATCEFTKYDDPKFQSAGELAVLNPNGGAIASLTTTRLVYVSSNSLINRSFWTKYGFPAPNESVPTVGDVFQKLKNRPDKTDDDKKFALLGDASMKLAFPNHFIKVDSVQAKDAQFFADTLKAFSVVTMKGHIDERLKGKFVNFNGTLWAKIFDKPKSQYTLGNDGNGSTVEFKDLSTILYNGQISVVNGDWTLVFSIPKDISYNVGEARAMFYAHNGETDASGAYNFLLGGSEKLNKADTIGPEVRAFLHDTTFRAGGSVAKNVDFVARIYDENGINATGAGIGRDMVLIIDENTEAEITMIVNQYFQYDVNSFRSGILRVPLNNLSPGKHTFTCKVWDIYNNYGDGSTFGIVVPARSFKIENHGASPNPFQQNTKLWIEQTLPGEDLNLDWQISDVAGNIVVKGSKYIEAAFAVSKIQIDLRNEVESGGEVSISHNLTPGIYLYQISARTLDGLTSKCAGKIICTQ